LADFKKNSQSARDCLLNSSCTDDRGTPNDATDDWVFNYQVLFSGLNYRSFVSTFKGDYPVQGTLPDPTYGGFVIQAKGQTPTEDSYNLQYAP